MMDACSRFPWAKWRWDRRIVMCNESERKAAINGGHKCGRALFHLLKAYGIEKPSDVGGIPEGIVPECLCRVCIDIPYQNKIIDDTLWRELHCIGMIAAGASVLPDFSFGHEGMRLWVKTLLQKNSNVTKEEPCQRYIRKMVEVSGRLGKLTRAADKLRQQGTRPK
jgi:hypothetical protein